MRTREEIEAYARPSSHHSADADVVQTIKLRCILEVLLDIRDLLDQR